MEVMNSSRLRKKVRRGVELSAYCVKLKSFMKEPSTRFGDMARTVDLYRQNLEINRLVLSPRTLHVLHRLPPPKANSDCIALTLGMRFARAFQGSAWVRKFSSTSPRGVSIRFPLPY